MYCVHGEGKYCNYPWKISSVNFSSMHRKLSLFLNFPSQLGNEKFHCPLILQMQVPMECQNLWQIPERGKELRTMLHSLSRLLNCYAAGTRIRLTERMCFGLTSGLDNPDHSDCLRVHRLCLTALQAIKWDLLYKWKFFVSSFPLTLYWTVQEAQSDLGWAAVLFMAVALTETFRYLELCLGRSKPATNLSTSTLTHCVGFLLYPSLTDRLL